MYQKQRSDVLYLKMLLHHIYRKADFTLEMQHSGVERTLDLESEDLHSGLGFAPNYLCDLEEMTAFLGFNFLICKMRGRT